MYERVFLSGLWNLCSHLIFFFFFSSINQANLSFVVGLKNGEVIFLHQSQKNSENFQENKDKHG